VIVADVVAVFVVDESLQQSKRMILLVAEWASGSGQVVLTPHQMTKSVELSTLINLNPVTHENSLRSYNLHHFTCFQSLEIRFRFR
jgi:hypothetical protein